MARDPDVPVPLSAWPDTFQPDDTRTPVGGSGACYYVYGPPNQAKVVACPTEQVPTTNGKRDIRAVVFVCPECGTRGRIDERKPFRVVDQRLVFRTAEGPVPLSPILTVESPVKCDAEYDVHDTDSNRHDRMHCTFHAVIRDGVAYPMQYMQGILTKAMQGTHARYDQAVNLFQSAAGRLHPDARQKAQSDLLIIFQRVLPSVCPVIESGQYERGGERSLVGCWEALDAARAACEQMITAMGGRL